ncbi:MAG: IS66 family transposase, partial [Dehalococcoidia bacterium]
NPFNSSKPPSSDIVKPPKPPPKKGGSRKKRRIGGQPGHAKHERRPLPPEEVDKAFEYWLCECGKCGGPLSASALAPQLFQHVELVGRSIEVSNHWIEWSWCATCEEDQHADLPEVLRKSGLFGPRMRAFVAYLKGACHTSYKTIRTLLLDVFGISTSTGYLAKVVNDTSCALAVPYAELRDALAAEPWLNVDETGHKNNGKRYWTWCFRARSYTVFRVDPSRGSKVLKEILGEVFGGVLGADYYSAYHKYMADCNVLIQFCMAHLIRDVRYMTTLADKVTKNYGQRVLDALKRLFKILHRREKMSAERFAKRMEQAKAEVIKKALSAPPRSEAQNMAARFRSNSESYFRFITTPGVEPTNNLAEQAIRHVVIDRRITQGTRGTNGQRWSERIWSTMASCAQQRRSSFQFISEAVLAEISGLPPPSLLPA